MPLTCRTLLLCFVSLEVLTGICSVCRCLRNDNLSVPGKVVPYLIFLRIYSAVYSMPPSLRIDTITNFKIHSFSICSQAISVTQCKVGKLPGCSPKVLSEAKGQERRGNKEKAVFIKREICYISL